MTEQKRWDKAGVQLTPAEAAARDRLAVVRNEQREKQRREDERIAFEKWQCGLVVPHAITTALNAHGLYGPEVDEACGVREPAVDLREEGKLYPTWDQLAKLAKLTQYRVIYFVTARQPISVLDTSMRFHVKPGVLASEQPVMRFPDVVWQRCPGTGWPSAGDVS